jgi:hypothetical protein
MSKILVADDALLPQRAVTSVGPNPLIPSEEFYMHVYTGAVHVGHYAGQDPSNLDVQFPLVYIKDPNGSRLAIRPFATQPFPHPDQSGFLAAVAHTSISGFVDKTDPAIVHILSSRADLYQVSLHQQGGPQKVVWAVVLSATVKAQNAEFHHLGYQVTVLGKGSQEGKPADEIEVGLGPWDGTYNSVGPLIRHGATP